MANMNITGYEFERLRVAPISKRDSDVSTYSMACPRCGAGAGRTCRNSKKDPMARAHSERNRKLYVADRSDSDPTISGFVTAAVANGDYVVVYATPSSVSIAGVTGELVAESKDLDMGLSAVLMRMPTHSFVILQVRTEDVRRAA